MTTVRDEPRLCKQGRRTNDTKNDEKVVRILR